MRTCELRRTPVGARLGWLPSGESGRILEKTSEGVVVRWGNGTVSTLTWSDAKNLAHAGRAPRPDVAARAKGGA